MFKSISASLSVEAPVHCFLTKVPLIKSALLDQCRTQGTSHPCFFYREQIGTAIRTPSCPPDELFFSPAHTHAPSDMQSGSYQRGCWHTWSATSPGIKSAAQRSICSAVTSPGIVNHSREYSGFVNTGWPEFLRKGMVFPDLFSHFPHAGMDTPRVLSGLIPNRAMPATASGSERDLSCLRYFSIINAFHGRMKTNRFSIIPQGSSLNRQKE